MYLETTRKKCFFDYSKWIKVFLNIFALSMGGAHMNTSQGLSSLFIAGLYDFVPAACSYSGAQILASTRRTSSILVYCSTRIHAMKYKSLVVLRGCVTRLSSLDSLPVRARPDSKGESWRDSGHESGAPLRGPLSLLLLPQFALKSEASTINDSSSCLSPLRPTLTFLEAVPRGRQTPSKFKSTQSP